MKGFIIDISKKIKIHRPDDWHVHLRDNDILKIVLPYTSKYFGRALIMPNIIPPIITIKQAKSYRKRIYNAIPKNDQKHFSPLMTCYLTNKVKKYTLIEGYKQGVFTAAKLYIANSTTNSQYGITNITSIYHLLEVMQKINMPLLIHGEIIKPDIDIFDREARFIEMYMQPIRYHFPMLKIVLEHISTKEAVEYVLSGDKYLGATITPHHLMFNRNDMFAGGFNPHLYCLPILKHKKHQKALHKAISSGCNRFFLGTDTAPHSREKKESNYGCAGIFSAPIALQAYASIFEKNNILSNLEAFCSFNGPNFYGLPINKDYITLKLNNDSKPITTISKSNKNKNTFIPYFLNINSCWKIIDENNNK